MIWGREMSARFQELRDREEAGALVDSERHELHALVKELEATEAGYLQPATDRLREQRVRAESQNAALTALVEREERLCQRLEEVLAELRAERQTIEEERARILQGGAIAGAGR